MKEVKRRKKNVAVTWIDYKKALDIRYPKILLRNSMETW